MTDQSATLSGRIVLVAFLLLTFVESRLGRHLQTLKPKVKKWWTISFRLKRVWRIAGVSALLLVPCFWHRTIQAGDLSSHIYNSWLAQEIDLGKAPGLVIAHQWTNVLFDLILSGLFRAFGAQAAQRLAVSAAVLLFFWGAFTLISLVNNSRPWFLTPCLAMLAYGWTFHCGLFNYYLSVGLGLWAIVLFWKGGVARVAIGTILMVLTYTAHAVGFGWAAGTLAYAFILRRSPERFRLLLAVCGLGLVAGLRVFIISRFATYWSPHQVLEISAVDQVWTFGLKYCGVSIGLALLWSFLFLRLTHAQNLLDLISGLPFQLCLITSASILLIPTRIELPGFHNALSFITERMTLVLAVMICVLLGASKPSAWFTGSFLLLAGIYFSFLYVDTGALNAAEQSIDAALSQLPPGQRVYSSFSGTGERVLLWPHAVDRACIGRCISYNNYEPYSAAFRIRAVADTPFVIRSAEEHDALANGGYVVKDRDLPLYQLQLCGAATQSLCAKPMQRGEVTRSYTISLLPLLW